MESCFCICAFELGITCIGIAVFLTSLISIHHCLRVIISRQDLNDERAAAIAAKIDDRRIDRRNNRIDDGRASWQPIFFHERHSVV